MVFMFDYRGIKKRTITNKDVHGLIYHYNVTSAIANPLTDFKSSMTNETFENISNDGKDFHLIDICRYRLFILLF